MRQLQLSPLERLKWQSRQLQHCVASSDSSNYTDICFLFFPRAVETQLRWLLYWGCYSQGRRGHGSSLFEEAHSVLSKHLSLHFSSITQAQSEERILVAACRNGLFYALDARSGRRIWVRGIQGGMDLVAMDTCSGWNSTSMPNQVRAFGAARTVLGQEYTWVGSQHREDIDCVHVNSRIHSDVWSLVR